eukprot:10994071-Ditylum_brightwellii.AAC.1
MARKLREQWDKDLGTYESSDEKDEYVERRLGPKDGGAYTEEEFIDFYGGTAEWDSARQSSSPRKGGGGSSTVVTGERKIHKKSWRFQLQKAGPLEADIPSGQRKQIASALRPVSRELHKLLPLLTDVHNHMAGFEQERWEFNKRIMSGMNRGECDLLAAREYCVVSVEPADWHSC